MPLQPYLYLCCGHTCGYTQQSNTAAVVIYLFMPWPCPGRICIRVVAVFLFVPRPYLDWKHTHNHQRIGEMAHTQQSNNAAAAVFVFVLRPYMWIHTTVKYRGRGHISIHAMTVSGPFFYLCLGLIWIGNTHATIKE